MSGYFPELKSSGGKVKVELDLSNYATKVDLKYVLIQKQVLIHLNLLKKVDLADLKSNADKLNIDKLKNVTSNLKKFEK